MPDDVFQLAPFQCPSCGHELIVDSIVSDEAEPLPTWTVLSVSVLDVGRKPDRPL